MVNATEMGFEEALNAIILYDDFEHGLYSKAMLEGAANHASGAIRWRVWSWQFDMLVAPAATDALMAATTAHLIVLAVRNQAGLPSWMPDWLELWASGRRVPDAVLAISEGERGNRL